MLELRKVNVEDWDFILKIRNEEKYRMYFYEQKKISKEEHYEYLKKMSTNSNFFNWIICYDSKDVGYIRILNEDISIMMDLEFNGKGLGTKALKLVENKARENGIKKLVGKVMIDNEKSKKIFEKNDYKQLMYWYETEIL